MGTEGFYKLDENGELLYAPNFVYSPKFTLLIKEKDKYTYPIEGWKWFDSEEQAMKENKMDVIMVDLTVATEKELSLALKKINKTLISAMAVEAVIEEGVKKDG